MESGTHSRWRAIDRGLYALFSRHADRERHERDRQRYRAAGLDAGFDVYLARVYALGWATGLGCGLLTVALVALIPGHVVSGLVEFLERGLPLVNRLPALPVGRIELSVVGGLVVGACARFAVVRGGTLYLRVRATARRDDIARTLPGAVRYLRVLASGSNDQRDMLGRVADQPAYGATAASFRRALNRASLSGSLDDGLSMVLPRGPPLPELVTRGVVTANLVEGPWAVFLRPVNHLCAIGANGV
jgi:hypothetical protein